MKTETEILCAAHNIRTEVMAKYPEHRTLLMSFPIVVSRRLSRSLGQVKFLGKLRGPMTIGEYDGDIRIWTPLRLELSWAAFQHDANWNEMRDTVLHEIAHVLAGRKADHNHVWVSWAIKLGAKPSACGNVPVSPVKPIRIVQVLCNRCQNPLSVTSRQAAMHTNGTRRYRHKNCQISLGK